jgi:hypothetical protein
MAGGCNQRFVVAEKCVGCNKDGRRRFFLGVGCLVTCSTTLASAGGSTSGLHFCWCSLSTESQFQGESQRFWPSSGDNNASGGVIFGEVV